MTHIRAIANYSAMRATLPYMNLRRKIRDVTRGDVKVVKEIIMEQAIVKDS